MNPPFSKKRSNLYELNFVLETLNHMKEGGILASILPLSCATGQKFKDLRRQLLNKHSLLKVITLPKDLFQPNAGTNTCIMIFKAKMPNNEPTIEQYDFSDDGYVIAKHIGRIDKNHDEKIQDFFRQKPVFKKVTYKDN
jgi:type I restriction-modification system DNA methylase subunit